MIDAPPHPYTDAGCGTPPSVPWAREEVPLCPADLVRTHDASLFSPMSTGPSNDSLALRVSALRDPPRHAVGPRPLSLARCPTGHVVSTPIPWLAASGLPQRLTLRQQPPPPPPSNRSGRGWLVLDARRDEKGRSLSSIEPQGQPSHLFTALSRCCCCCRNSAARAGD